MSEVWLGERVRPAARRPVVRRIPERGGDGRCEDRLQRLIELRHPALVQILDHGRDAQGRLFVLREEVAGEPILAYCGGHRAGARTRLMLIEEAREALRSAHRAGIVHGRLSARMLLVETREGEPRLRIVGFEKGALGPRASADDDLRALDEVSAELADPRIHIL